MKMAKKFLAVALAGVLALSVLTGCGASVKSKDIADALNKMHVSVKQDDGVDKTAKETLKAIEAIIASDTNTAAAAGDKITLDNAVEGHYGKVIMSYSITDITNAVQKALGVYIASGAADAEKANKDNQVRVALVEIKNAKKNASLQAALAKGALVEVQAATVTPATQKVAETGKLGIATTKDGKYMLVVIVNDVVAKA